LTPVKRYETVSVIALKRKNCLLLPAILPDAAHPLASGSSKDFLIWLLAIAAASRLSRVSIPNI
jgi:hypothetical protein